jgi:hypothetical protein
MGSRNWGIRNWGSRNWGIVWSLHFGRQAQGERQFSGCLAFGVVAVAIFAVQLATGKRLMQKDHQDAGSKDRTGDNSTFDNQSNGRSHIAPQEGLRQFGGLAP